MIIYAIISIDRVKILFHAVVLGPNISKLMSVFLFVTG